MLRQWRDEDYAPFSELNADPEVMRYFPSCLTRQQSDELANRIRELIADQGWGFWALQLRDQDVRDQDVFAGFVGLHIPSARLPCSPCVEVGWRLARDYWGQGYASEAATLALNYGFDTLALDRIVAFTARNNHRSRNVMTRIGMHNTGLDFMHPDIETSHVLAPHVLYSISR